MGIDGSTLAQMSLASQIGGAATSSIGGFFGASTQRANLAGQSAIAEANARIADANAAITKTTANTNARIAELGAQSVLDQGNKQTAALTLKAGQIKSSQRAALAANGVDLGDGNAAEVQASTDIMKDIDVNTISANAVRSAWGYRTQATNYQNEALSAESNGWAYRADAATKRASASSISPASSAATSLLGGAGTVASSWAAFKKNGLI